MYVLRSPMPQVMSKTVFAICGSFLVAFWRRTGVLLKTSHMVLLFVT